MLPHAVSPAPANDQFCLQDKIALTWSEDYTSMISMIMLPTFNQARSDLPED
jgi:hypothetical protein